MGEVAVETGERVKLSPIVVRFTVLGVVPSLKNQKKIGRGRMYDDSQVVRYKSDFGLQVPAKFKDLYLGTPTDFLGCTITLFHDSWKRDADAEIIYDCLQTAGVVKNDRWIRRKIVYAERIDAENPRCEITLSYI